MQQAELPQPPSTAIVTAAAHAWSTAMATGDFTAAWRASDIILAARPASERDDPSQPYHLRWVWDGTPVDGRAALVRCYHGLGDTLQFCRYLPALRQRATHVTLEVQPELIPLLSRLPGVDRLVPFDPAAPHPASGCDVEIMELAHVLRIAPQPVPYLDFVTPGLDPKVTEKLQVGLCWHVNAAWRPHRSVPAAALAMLLATDVSWQSLQKDAAHGMTPCPAAVLDTAATIAGLDLVITVDTMVAHLAGAIGTPTWLLLDTEPDWRWWAAGPASPRGSLWYRGIRKYHQSQPGDWQAPLHAVTADLTRSIAPGHLRREL